MTSPASSCSPDPEGQMPLRLTRPRGEHMFVVVPRPSRLTDERLDALYKADGFGGDSTMRAKVFRELIDEIRALRTASAGDERPCGPPTTT
jgi:hypothetical protein